MKDQLWESKIEKKEKERKGKKRKGKEREEKERKGKRRKGKESLAASHPTVKGQRPQERWIGVYTGIAGWETPVAQSHLSE